MIGTGFNAVMMIPIPVMSLRFVGGLFVMGCNICTTFIDLVGLSVGVLLVGRSAIGRLLPCSEQAGERFFF